MKTKHFICCICGREFAGFGNNPYPVDNAPDHRCCDDCNSEYVIPARLDLMYNKKEDK